MPPAPLGLSPRSDSDGMSLFPFVFDSLRNGFSSASANPCRLLVSDPAGVLMKVTQACRVDRLVSHVRAPQSQSRRGGRSLYAQQSVPSGEAQGHP